MMLFALRIEHALDVAIALRTPVHRNHQRFNNVSRIAAAPSVPTAQIAEPPSLTIVGGGRRRGGKYGFPQRVRPIRVNGQ
jgi:hypothetical protein